MKKENKKTAVFYNEIEHLTAMREGDTIGLLFKEAKNELETILEAPIKDYTAFRNDVLGYSIAEIKNKFPKPFDLGLPIEKVLAMLSIDLRMIERVDATLKTTPHKFCVCPKTGDATADSCREDFIWYATTDEQHERLDFANELATILERAYLFTPHTYKSNVTNGLTHIVYFDVQTETIKPNHYFVMTGIK
jgi:hypothetical protein